MAPKEEGVNLRDLVAQMVRRRGLIATMVVLFAALAVVAAVLQPKKYDAAVVLMPAPDTDSGTESTLRGGVSGLMAIAGLSAGGGEKATESMAVLQSEALTRKFIESNNLLPVLYADRWDAKANRWKAADAKHIPTLWMADQYFIKNVRSVKRDTTTGLVTVTVRWKDPAVAARWANGLVALTNQYLRDGAISRSERNIDYLNEQAARTNVVGVRQAIYNLMEDELKRVMFARGSDEYAFRVIDPATVPERPSNLPAWLIVAAGVISGLMLGIFILLVELAWRGPR